MISLAYILLSILWFALIAYACFGGADFGAGIWELFASGKTAQHERELIDEAIGPVWETNHVWLVFLVVGLFSSFPVAFSILSEVLFVPLTLALFGAVLRGAGFIFRTHGLQKQGNSESIWSRIFSVSSLMTPLFLGMSAAAVASGQILVRNGSVATSPLAPLFWITPFSLTIGAMAIALCATLAAIFLTVEATSNKDDELAETFRVRGLIAGGVTAVFGALGLLLSPGAARDLWGGMLNHGIPLVIATMLIGLGAAGTLYFGYYRLSRALIIAETAFLLGTWGVSQIPYIIPPNLTVNAAAGQTSTLVLLLIGIIVGMAIMLPSLGFLFYIFKYGKTMGFFSKGNVPRTKVGGEKLPALK